MQCSWQQSPRSYQHQWRISFLLYQSQQYRWSARRFSQLITIAERVLSSLYVQVAQGEALALVGGFSPLHVNGKLRGSISTRGRISTPSMCPATHEVSAASGSEVTPQCVRESKGVKVASGGKAEKLAPSVDPLSSELVPFLGVEFLNEIFALRGGCFIYGSLYTLKLE